jgi:c-di-GMP-binding flagellar brake protein YcgR
VDFLFRFRSLFRAEEARDIRKSFEEKRYDPRARCACEAKCLLPGNREVRVSIIEVSASGMRLRGEQKMNLGDIVSIQPVKKSDPFSTPQRENHPVRMEVVWNKKQKGTGRYVIGLHYADDRKSLQDSWAASILKKYGISVGIEPHRRRNIRIPVDLALSITAGNEFFRGSVKDIGISGMLMGVDREIDSGGELRFRIGPYKHLQGLICRGRIAHRRFLSSVKHWVYGVVFLPMSEKQSELLCQYLTLLCLEGSESP